MELDFSQFNLTKVKLIKDGGLDVHWEQTVKNGAITDTEKEHKESTREPHPDLVTKINFLKPLLAKMWGFDAVKLMSENEKFKGTADQIDKAKRAYTDLLKDLEVSGIMIRGAGEKMVVNITGKRRMYKKIFQPCGSGRIQLNQKLYGFENDIEDLVPEIKQEVYDYLFKGKCANPTLFGDKEQNGKKEPAKAEKKAPAKAEKRKVGEPQKQLETD